MSRAPVATSAAAPYAPDTPRVVLVEDDPLALARLRTLVAARGDLAIVAECVDGPSALDALCALRPDVALLDVQLPGLDALDVVARLGASERPALVFVSGYSEFAVRAFEACALDYVLKPYDDARLMAALDRALGEVARQRAPSAADACAGDPRVEALLDLLARADRMRYPDALAVRVGGRYAVVRVADVDWIVADGNHARVVAQGRPRLVARSLVTLEREVLDPTRFVRVHRSLIVQVARVATVEPRPSGDLVLVLHDGTRLPCSRRYRDRLEARLYFTT